MATSAPTSAWDRGSAAPNALKTKQNKRGESPFFIEKIEHASSKREVSLF
jgi:hypothetical protein